MTEQTTSTDEQLRQLLEQNGFANVDVARYESYQNRGTLKVWFDE